MKVRFETVMFSLFQPKQNLKRAGKSSPRGWGSQQSLGYGWRKNRLGGGSGLQPQSQEPYRLFLCVSNPVRRLWLRQLTHLNWEGFKIWPNVQDAGTSHRSQKAHTGKKVRFGWVTQEIRKFPMPISYFKLPKKVIMFFFPTLEWRISKGRGGTCPRQRRGLWPPRKYSYAGDDLDRDRP